MGLFATIGGFIMTYKRIFLVICIVFSLGIISGCSINNESPSENESIENEDTDDNETQESTTLENNGQVNEDATKEGNSEADEDDYNPVEPTTNIDDLEPSNHSDLNNVQGITMGIKEGTISKGGLTVVFENNSEKEFTYGNYFLLEQEANGDWYEVPVTIEGNYGFEDIGYELKAGKTGDWKADWQWLYGELSSGKYRIIKDVLDFRKTADFDKHYMATEFEIK